MDRQTNSLCRLRGFAKRIHSWATAVQWRNSVGLTIPGEAEEEGAVCHRRAAPPYGVGREVRILRRTQ